ncbi:(2Fe-2S) ferredoxin domain-containing protein [Rubrobacter indicoceani]|uniref:(2Fe-2S) ferredoxin domain-containing protein n=1 Tax=Rubrobacter indicoceani TaxID=2051957 RepID=UPI000E5BCE6F|nr:(2Fe-2S) ferredoxin domain-containing protein [Rubrobacter indicoceani]
MTSFKQILVCATPGSDASGPRCGERGGCELLDAFRAEVASRGLPASVVDRQPCSRRHHEGPVVFVFPDDEWYTGVGPEDVPGIVDRHLGGVKAGR